MEQINGYADNPAEGQGMTAQRAGGTEYADRNTIQNTESNTAINTSQNTASNETSIFKPVDILPQHVLNALFSADEKVCFRVFSDGPGRSGQRKGQSTTMGATANASNNTSTNASTNASTNVSTNQVINNPNLAPPPFKGAKLEKEAGRYSQIEETLKKHNEQNRGIFFVVNYGGQDDASITRVNAQFVEMDDKTFAEQERLINAFPLPPSMVIRTKKSYHTYWFMKNAAKSTGRRRRKKQSDADGLMDGMMGNVVGNMAGNMASIMAGNMMENMLTSNAGTPPDAGPIMDNSVAATVATNPNSADVRLFRPIQKALVKHFGGDPMCVNESRVMRLPGFTTARESR